MKGMMTMENLAESVSASFAMEGLYLSETEKKNGMSILLGEKTADSIIEQIKQKYRQEQNKKETLETMKEYEEGKSIGPFNSVKDFMADLYS